jgi:hypothetical protein
MSPCSTLKLMARSTVSVYTDDVGGQVGISFVVVDAASGEPLPDQGEAPSAPEVLLGPYGSVELPLQWSWDISRHLSGLNLPPKLAFVVTVQLTDATGHRVAERVTVPEQLPRPWRLF